VAGHRAGEGELIGEEVGFAELLSLSSTLERERGRKNEEKNRIHAFIDPF